MDLIKTKEKQHMTKRAKKNCEIRINLAEGPVLRVEIRGENPRNPGTKYFIS
jgi:hypothetical protein